MSLNLTTFTVRLPVSQPHALCARFAQVDAAVELVEQGKGEEAVAVLKEGISAFEPNFPDRCGV